MLKNTKNLGLCALLGFTSCGLTENDHSVPFGKPDETLLYMQTTVAPVAGKVASPSPAGYRHSNLSLYINEDSYKAGLSASLGPITLLPSSDMDYLRVKLFSLPALELPVRSRDEFYGVESGFDYSYSNGFDDWMVGNGIVNNYERPIPISFLGKVLKEYIWSSSFARPMREVSEGLSEFSNAPAGLIFGDILKSEIKLKLDSERVGVRWVVKKWRWDFGIDCEYAFGNGEETALRFFMSTGIGPGL